MPYPGVPDKNIKKMDDCVQNLMKQGHDKSLAIAICHSSIIGKEELDLKKGDVPDEKFDSEQLKKGIEVEKEHTNDPAVAKQIAKAHLTENPQYYKYLDDMEKKMKQDQPKKEENLRFDKPVTMMGPSEEAVQGELGPMCKQVADYLKQTPNPTDAQMHEWAEQAGLDIHQVEQAAYKLATMYVQNQGKTQEQTIHHIIHMPKESVATGVKYEKIRDKLIAHKELFSTKSKIIVGEKLHQMKEKLNKLK